MTYRINYNLPDGSEDSFIISGNTLDEIIEKAHYELDKRGGIDAWSEEL